MFMSSLLTEGCKARWWWREVSQEIRHVLISLVGNIIIHLQYTSFRPSGAEHSKYRLHHNTSFNLYNTTDLGVELIQHNSYS